MTSSVSELTNFLCPKCNTEFTADIYKIIAMHERPDLLELFKSDMINHLSCPNCDFTGWSHSPILLFEPNRKPPIIFVANYDLTEADNRAIKDELLRKLRWQLQDAWRSSYMQNVPSIDRMLIPNLVHEYTDVNRIVEIVRLIEKCKGYGDTADAAYFVQENPELTNSEVLSTIQQYIDFYLRFGDERRTISYQACLDLIYTCMSEGAEQVAQRKQREYEEYWKEHPELLHGLEQIMENMREKAKKAQEIQIPFDLKDAVNQIMAIQERGDFSQAANLWEQVVNHPSFATAQQNFRWIVLHDAGTTWLHTYQIHGEKSYIDRAVELLQKCLACTRDDNANLLTNLGTALILRHRHYTYGTADLDQAIELFTRAVAPALIPHQPDYALRLTNLGGAFIERFKRSLTKSDITQGLNILREAQREAPTGVPYLPLILSNLATSTYQLYLLNGNLADLDEAFHHSKEATGMIEPTLFPVEYADVINVLGMLYIARYDLSAKLRLNLETELLNINNAIECFEKAIEISPTRSTRLAAYKMNWGVALVKRYEHNSEVQDLNDGLLKLREALQQALPDSAEYLDAFSNFTSILTANNARINDQTIDLDKIIQEAEIVHQLRPHDPMYNHNLGQLYFTRYERLGSYVDFQHGKQALQTAINHAKELDPVNAIMSAKALGAHMLEVEEWDESAAAYEQAVTIADSVFRTQFERHYKETFLQQIKTLYPNASYAHAKAGNIQSAVVTAEWGHARLLTDVLNRNQELLSPLTLEQIVATAKPMPLIYIIVVLEGAVAYVVYPDFKIVPIWLPRLDFLSISQQKLGSLDNNRLEGLLGIETRMHIARREKQYELLKQLRKEWIEKLESVLSWLWKVLMHPLIGELKSNSITQAVLIPAGVLNDLPLHAAWTQDSSATTGRRYALDDITFSYAPNALSLYQAQQKANRLGLDSILAIDNPTNDPHLRSNEVHNIMRFFETPKRQVLGGDGADIATVLNRLSSANILHFNTHGVAKPIEPLKSHLVMAHGQALTVQHLFEIPLAQTRLAVLSACETQIAGANLPEEMINLPTAFLQAGVPGVVGTLWPVTVTETAQFMVRFYELIKIYNESPSSAMKKTQQWMRDQHVSLEHWSAFMYTGV